VQAFEIVNTVCLEQQPLDYRDHGSDQRHGTVENKVLKHPFISLRSEYCSERLSTSCAIFVSVDSQDILGGTTV
jgi:hypothetical protein